MADRTKIEWATATLNPIRARNRTTDKIGHYCEHASDGCRHCYSEVFNQRGIGAGVPFQRQNRDLVELYLDDTILTKPLHWQKPRRIFWNSMTDFAAEFVPDEWIDRMLAVCALTPQHTHLFLTKRAKRMLEYFTASGTKDVIIEAIREIGAAAEQRARYSDKGQRVTRDVRLGCDSWAAAFNLEREFTPWPLPNVWLGVSVEDQANADERIPELLATPAAVRFISAEPLLGPIDLTNIRIQLAPHSWMTRSALYAKDPLDKGHPENRVDWVIAGGESGPTARPMHPDWARSLRDQCQAAGVPFFFKQWGTWLPDGLLDNARARGIVMRPNGSQPTDADLPAIMGGNFDFTGYQHFSAVGKDKAGRLLDGVTHDGMPT